MSAPLPSLPVTFRPTRTRVVLYAVGIAQLAALTVIALLLPKLTGGERLSFVVTGLLVLAVLLLLSRPKVVARQEGVTVVNLTTKRELAWAQVVRVNLREGDPWVHLDLADGTSLPAMGIQPGIARDQAIRDARALRDLTEKHGAVDHTAG
ncbi:PH domain-containing protein [Streptomyces sp. 2224.1]|uniref:PH domain-containing protein n=1 Tax=unclassified Streptomyces TaxID=2593676 RepID=UPI00088695B1|nr:MULTISPECIES: PH domain-containing protein [unclassified Streptomyces]PBC81242.1 PH (Pleckstrin Homology) domain-containing protein [Streptomyces sp. 2321.6]SDR55876.1 PH domain-containing protein [Streptomyces sp. KS_16]SEC07106.1 PH domain-containing protein [Streptomyces sp. 2133.1]SED22247.1 PH domain-containing protein [Streptomyces sp. 2224.1]SEF09328.1 PH domain-containing protein [Streptomyces sp. 2112.3]